MKVKRNVIFIILIIIVSISSISLATINPDNFQPNTLKQSDYEQVFNIAGVIINAITVIGTVISVVMVMSLGIKYMLGSIEEKAEYKKTMVPMLIGAILLFAGTTIVSIIYQLMENI